MEITAINTENLQLFQSLLYPATVEAISVGLPVVALGAVDEGAACGALSGVPDGDAIAIHSIFVAHASRGRGAGAALISELSRIARPVDGIYELRSSFTLGCEDHETLPGFFKALGFRVSELVNGVVSVPLSALEKLPFYENTKPDYKVYSFNELSENMLRSYEKRMKIDAGPILHKPLMSAPLDRECSVVTVSGSEIDGCMLVERLGERKLSLSYADAGSNQNAGVFSSMLITAYHLAIKKYPPDTEILIQPVTTLAQALVSRLAPEARRISYSAVRPLILEGDVSAGIISA